MGFQKDWMKNCLLHKIRFLCSTKKIVYAKHRPSAKSRAGYALFLNKGDVNIITFSDISIFVISLIISFSGIGILQCYEKNNRPFDFRYRVFGDVAL